ncbi:MAG: sialidase family protein [Marinosulfonomonas sp.]
MTADSLPDSPDSIAARMDGIARPLDGARSIAFLPSPRVQNHAAFLLRHPKMGLICAWFGGGLEGKSDICIHTSQFDEATGTWGAAQQVTDDPDRSEQNPVLFVTPDNKTVLLHTAQPGGDQDRCVVRMREIGEQPTDLTLPLGTFVRARPIVREDGAWLLPLFHCVHSPGARWTGRNDYASVAITHDQGKTWRMVQVPDSTGCVHMTLVPLQGNKIVAFFRRRQADFVFRTQSTDGGETWARPEPTDVPNNNSSISAIQLADGRIAMVCNPINAAMDPSRRPSLYDELGNDDRPEAEGGCTPIWGVSRAPLILALSTDTGKTFPKRIIIADGSGACLSNNSEDGKNKELSYPALSQSKDGDIDICFTYHRRAIAHIRVPNREIEDTK